MHSAVDFVTFMWYFAAGLMLVLFAIFELIATSKKQ